MKKSIKTLVAVVIIAVIIGGLWYLGYLDSTIEYINGLLA